MPRPGRAGLLRFPSDLTFRWLRFHQHIRPREFRMLWFLFIVLLFLWLAGIVSSFVVGGLVHVLLIAAVLVLVWQIMREPHRVS